MRSLMLSVVVMALLAAAPALGGATSPASAAYRHASEGGVGEPRVSLSAICAADMAEPCEDVLMYDLESGTCVTNLDRPCDETLAEDNVAPPGLK